MLPNVGCLKILSTNHHVWLSSLQVNQNFAQQSQCEALFRQKLSSYHIVSQVPLARNPNWLGKFQLLWRQDCSQLSWIIAATDLSNEPIVEHPLSLNLSSSKTKIALFSWLPLKFVTDAHAQLSKRHIAEHQADSGREIFELRMSIRRRDLGLSSSLPATYKTRITLCPARCHGLQCPSLYKFP